MEYNDVITRNIGVLTVEEQEKIRNTTIAIVGIGGIGSSAALLAAKSGFGRLIVIDKDNYQLHNLSLQMLATTETINIPKTKTAENILPLHNPFLEIEAITMDIQKVEEVKNILNGADYMISAVDDPVCRVLLDRGSRQAGVINIMGSAIGSRVYNTVFLPTGISYEKFARQFSLNKEITPDVENLLRLHQRIFTVCVADFDPLYAEKYLKKEVTYSSVIGIAAVLGACSAVSEVIKLTTGRGEPIVAPEIFAFDLLTSRPWDVKETLKKISLMIETVLSKGLNEGIKFFFGR